MFLSSDSDSGLCKEHIICDCLVLVWTRRNHLLMEIAVPAQQANSSTKDLLYFIRKAEQHLSG